MSTRSLAILAAITAVILLAALLTSQSRTIERASTEGEPLVPELAERINDVAEIEIREGDRVTILARRADRWVYASGGGFPVRFQPVKELLLQLAEVEISERKTSDPDQHARLGVEDPSTEAETSVLVSLRDESGADIVSIILGNASGDERFARRLDADEVVQVAGRLNVSSLPMGWLEREVLRVPRGSIKQVSVAWPNGEAFAVVRSADGASYEMPGVPAGYRVRSPSQLRTLAGALSYVDLMDVIREDAVDLGALEQPLLATYTADDGMEINVSVWNDTERKKKWFGFQVAVAEDEAAESESESISASVADLQRRLHGWLFEPSQAVVAALEQELAMLIEPIPPAGPAPSDAAHETDPPAGP